MAGASIYRIDFVKISRQALYRSRERKTEERKVTADAGRGEPGAVSEREEFGGGEGGGDRYGSVMENEGAPAEERPGERQEAIGEGVALEVLEDHRAAGRAVHRGEEFDDLSVREVVEKKRAVYEVEGTRTEGKSEGIGGEARSRGEREIARQKIEASDTGLGKGARERAGDVSRGGADVEQSEPLVRGNEPAEQRTGDRVSAEPAIQESDLGEVESGFGGRGGVEPFRENNAFGAGEGQGITILKVASQQCGCDLGEAGRGVASANEVRESGAACGGAFLH